jgi:hypothetical protein
MTTSLSKRITALERTLREQEATILHLRNENSLLGAKLAVARRRKRVPTSKPKRTIDDGPTLAQLRRSEWKPGQPQIGRDGCYKRGSPGHLRGVRAAMGVLGG